MFQFVLGVVMSELILIMSSARKFFSLRVRCDFVTKFPRRFKIDTVDGLIEKISFSDEDPREIENLVILTAPCSIYFQQHDFLLMIDDTKFQTCSGKRSNRWVYEMVSTTKTIRSKRELQAYRHFITECNVRPFRRTEREDLEYSVDAEFEELDEDECDKLYKRIKDNKAKREKERKSKQNQEQSRRLSSSSGSRSSITEQKVFDREESSSEGEDEGESVLNESLKGERCDSANTPESFDTIDDDEDAITNRSTTRDHAREDDMRGKRIDNTRKDSSERTSTKVVNKNMMKF